MSHATERPHARENSAEDVARRYWEGMDRSMPQKLALLSGLMLLDDGATVVDAGCGSGAAAYHLARLNPRVTVIGIDLDDAAINACRARYPLPNLSFQRGNVAEPLDLQADAILSSSTLHHVFTFADPPYSSAAVLAAIEAHAASLKDGGVLAVRDFVVPDGPDDPVILSLLPKATSGDPGLLDEPSLLEEFARTARPLDRRLGPGFPLEELASEPGRPHRRFRLSRKSATEFLLRKDYRADWASELCEQYGYFTIDEFLAAFQAAGLGDARAVPVLNSWIVANRWAERAILQEEDGRTAPWPFTNLLVSGRKLASDRALQVRWHASPQPSGYLKLSHWAMQGAGETWTLVERPAQAIELLPWTWRDGRVRILARDGYPRPIATVADRRHPGRVIEPIAFAGDVSALPAVVESLGITSLVESSAVRRLTFLPSAGGIAEMAASYDLELTDLPAPKELTGPLSRAGWIRSFDAQDILRAGQVGALDEARLEIATAFLLRRLGVGLDAWTGDMPELSEPAGAGLPPVCQVPELFARHTAPFRPAPDPAAPWMAARAGLFKDVDASRTAISELTLDWAEPRSGSPCTGSILPVLRRQDGSYLVGIELRELPGAQIHTGNATMPCVPAWRLSARPKDAISARQMLTSMLDLPAGQLLTPLGGSYFASLGVTSERVFPYIADASCLPQSQRHALVFCDLAALVTAHAQIRDGHLLISLSRAAHALGVGTGKSNVATASRNGA
jgi:SAM-dependent methyltransferase